jgi:UDP-GlcNAc:undecaprenyl-phosphate/decaprenyl-phosphate GlcNAc-1-phosphate transferase
VLTLIAAFGLAVVAAWLLTPVVRDAAHGAGLLDEPEDRKVHLVPIPRLGGVAIGGAFFLGMAAALVVARATGAPLATETGQLPGILVGGALIAGVGLLDDLQGMRARVKLAAQLVVALVAYGLGLSIDQLSGPWGTIQLGAWALPLTVAWIVAVVNAVNLVDGVDGLASGVALTALAAYFGIGLVHGGIEPVLPVVAAGAGGVIGFLRYNLHPASIIMGDSGSLLIGFLLAAVGISLTQADPGGAAPWIPVLVVALPLADMAWAILRRVVARAPVFAPDKRHIHHQMMASGLSQRTTMLLLTAASAAFGAFGLVLALA